MKSSDAIQKDEQDHFWSIVGQCIRRFHAGCASRALAEATRLRKKVNGMPIEQMDLFYHAEPFDVAGNLADNALDVKDHLDEYLEIRDGTPRREKAPRRAAAELSRDRPQNIRKPDSSSFCRLPVGWSGGTPLDTKWRPTEMPVELYPLRFEPIFKHALWGGSSLRPLFGLEAPAEPEGKAWLLSDQGDNVSRVLDGPLQGKTLRELMNSHRQALIGDAGAPLGRFPLLLKLLDARQPLSVQVHPNDEQAQRLESANAGFGKTEAWVILQAEPGSQLYAGLRERVTGDEFRGALKGGTLPDVLHTVSPRPGDCFFLEAGTIHAIGAGLMLFEVQQTSDITYRLFDWGRVDAKTGLPRPLHIESAVHCTNVESGPCHAVKPERLAGTERERLVTCRYFTLERVRSDKRFSVGVPGQCRLVVCLDGRANISHKGKSYPLRLGDVLLLPAAIGPGECIPEGLATVLECGIP